MARQEESKTPDKKITKRHSSFTHDTNLHSMVKDLKTQIKKDKSKEPISPTPATFKDKLKSMFSSKGKNDPTWTLREKNTSQSLNMERSILESKEAA